MKFNKVEESEEVLGYLGFMERKVFHIESIENKTTDEILLEVLESDMFFEKQSCTDYREKPLRKYEIRVNHAFTDAIEINDFEKLTFDQFERKIEEIKAAPDWGDDLPIFEKLITKSKNWIITNKHESEQLYFIYEESILNAKLIENNYYAYFMTIVIISISTSLVIIINHGGD